jgi:hypothetical protein
LVAALILILVVGVVDSVSDVDVVMDVLVVVVKVRLSVTVAPLCVGSVAVVEILGVNEVVIVADRGDGVGPVVD